MSEIRPCPPFEPSHLQGEMDISYAVELIRDWHIGGQSEDAVRAVLAAIEQERHSQSQKTGKDARSNEQEG
jgi:hypothetical protein